MLKSKEVGRHLVAGFDGTEVNDHLTTLIKELGAGGIILFSRNYESPEQLAELTRRIREMADGRIFICVDQEGGRVMRLGEPFTQWPCMMNLGNSGDEELARSFGAAMVTELAAVGIDWDLAPVMDVNSNPDNPVIGDRAFGVEPEIVSKMGAAVIQGMQGAGVMACAKHYPGHGHTDLDSHHTLPKVLENEDVIYQRELVPFNAAIDTGVAAIMPAHVVYPTLDLSHPASVSRVLIEGQLRRALYFDGLVITDDLEMKAVADRYDPPNLSLLAFIAGNDFLLYCHTFELQEACVRNLYDGRLANLLAPELFVQSNKRIDAAAGKFPLPESARLDVIGCDEHRQLAGKFG